MNKFINLTKSYKFEILLTVGMFSNLYPDLPIWMYVALLIIFFFIAIKDSASIKDDRVKFAVLFMLTITLSTFINMSVTYRLLMILVILASTQLFSSNKFYHFKIRFLRVSLVGFAITPIINYYAHIYNINYQLKLDKWKGHSFTLDFAGFTLHPMWLSAACGIATIVFVFLLIDLWNKKNRWKAIGILPLLYASIMVSVWGGSRSALAISAGAAMFLIYLGNKKVSKMFGVLAVIVVLVAIAMPYFMEGSEKIVQKMEYQEKIGRTSREESWNERLTEFKSSPFWGIGLSAVLDEDGNLSVGTHETGSGWLTILSQTGLLGIVFALLLWKRGFVPIRYLHDNREMSLYFVILIYLSVHTMFEGYIFLPGCYLCFYFWLVLSVLGDYNRKIANKKLHNHLLIE